MKHNIVISATSFVASVVLLWHSAEALLTVAIIIFLMIAIFYTCLAMLDKYTMLDRNKAEAQAMAEAEAQERKRSFLHSYECIRRNL